MPLSGPGGTEKLFFQARGLGVLESGHCVDFFCKMIELY